mmetsp:Transcript_14174/g.24248  ORF Transcript_14174/g.24248 Transcript_14174/m.24248 type:complete len:278 (+) Transcript_14174:206-1039(+)
MGTRTSHPGATMLYSSLFTILVLISIVVSIPQVQAEAQTQTQAREVKHKSNNQDTLRYRYNYNLNYRVADKYGWNDIQTETQTHPRTSTCSLNMFAMLHDSATKQGKPNPCMPPPFSPNAKRSPTPKLQAPSYMVPLLCSIILGFFVFLVFFDYSHRGLLGGRRRRRGRRQSIISAQERRQVGKLSKQTQGKYLEQLLSKYILHMDLGGGSGGGGEEYEHGRCVICLDDLVLNHHKVKHARLVSCQHAFHAGCILDWLKHENSSCPVCRRTVFAEND